MKLDAENPTKSIKEKIKDSLYVLLGFFAIGVYVALFAGWIYGTSHAFDKHGAFAGVITLVFPPAALYFAPEGLFWHDENRDVDWNSRLETDQKNIGYILTGVVEELSPTDKMQLEAVISSYSRQIDEYPKKQKEELQNFARDLINYSISLQEGMLESFSGNIVGDKIILKKTITTKALEEKLIQKYPNTSEIVEQGNLALQMMNMQLENKNTIIETPEQKDHFDNLVSQMRVSLASRNKVMTETYKRLFATDF